VLLNSFTDPSVFPAWIEETFENENDYLYYRLNYTGGDINTVWQEIEMMECND